ncbi:MAG: hypothetical protein ACOYYS_08860 [Chloroflexota bacterium]
MRFKLIKASIFLMAALCLVFANGFASAAVPAAESGGSPFASFTRADGRQITVYLLPEDQTLTERALKEGLITQEQVNAARKVERASLAAGVGVCPFWTGSPATMIREGRDGDDDWYEDYEHPVGWSNDVICVTTFYYTAKGFPAEEFHNDYKPNIARHRLKVGLSGFPDWFAAAQTTLRWR